MGLVLRAGYLVHIWGQLTLDSKTNSPLLHRKRSHHLGMMRSQKHNIFHGELLTMNIYEPDDKIYKTNPPITNNSNFPKGTWTDTIDGYIYEAKKLTYCLLENKKLAGKPYTFFVTINFHQALTLKKINAFYNENWIANCEKLKKKGLIACWIIEGSKENKIHFHLVVLSNHTHKELAKIFEDCLPIRKSNGGWHKKIEHIKENDFRLLHYFTKGKLTGKTKKGREVDDLYKNKRILFKKRLGIKKLGSIGEFWFHSREKIWEDNCKKESKIAYGKGDIDAMCYRDYIYEGVIGGSYDDKKKSEVFFAKPLKYETRDYISRKLAYKHDCPDQKNRINNLKAEKNLFFADSEIKYLHLKNNRIEEGMQKKDIIIFAHYLFKYFYKGTHNFGKERYYTLKDIQETVAYSHQLPVYTDWISRLKLEEPEYFEKDPLDCLYDL